MESLMSGVKMTLQVVVGRLYLAAILFVKHLTEAPQSFARDILLCAVLLAFLIWRRCILRRKREVARRFAAQLDEDHESTQNLGRTHASEACESPAGGASPLKLQTLSLCSADPHQEIAGLDSLPEDSLNQEETSELRELSFPGDMKARLEVQMRLFKESSNTPQSQAAETKNTFEVSQKNMAAKWREGAWEMREEQKTCVKIQMNE